MRGKKSSFRETSSFMSKVFYNKKSLEVGNSLISLVISLKYAQHMKRSNKSNKTK